MQKGVVTNLLTITDTMTTTPWNIQGTYAPPTASYSNNTGRPPPLPLNRSQNPPLHLNNIRQNPQLRQLNKVHTSYPPDKHGVQTNDSATAIAELKKGELDDLISDAEQRKRIINAAKRVVKVRVRESCADGGWW